MIKIKNEELVRDLVGEIKSFPLYVTQLINLANQNVQGTRPRVVGQLSELIQECPEKTYEGWKKWYLAKYPRAIDDAAARVQEMVENLKQAIQKIDPAMIRRWVEDLVLEKTFIGLRFQEAILKKVAHARGASYRLASAEEEARGIDGMIGNAPVSIKPLTYKVKNALRETLNAKIVFYDKTKAGLEIDDSQL